jgi:hypothetical protein
MILEKLRKKKRQIWIIYDEEILVTKFNSRLKEEIPTIPCVLHLQSSQANSMLTRAGPYHNSIKKICFNICTQT